MRFVSNRFGSLKFHRLCLSLVTVVAFVGAPTAVLAGTVQSSAGCQISIQTGKCIEPGPAPSPDPGCQISIQTGLCIEVDPVPPDPTTCEISIQTGECIEH